MQAFCINNLKIGNYPKFPLFLTGKLFIFSDKKGNFEKMRLKNYSFGDRIKLFGPQLFFPVFCLKPGMHV